MTETPTVMRDEEDFEKALTSEDAVVRLQARASDADWLKAFAVWQQAEVQRPDFHPADFTLGLTKTFTSILASALAQMTPPEADGFTTEHVSRMFAEALPHTLEGVRKMMKDRLQ